MIESLIHLAIDPLNDSMNQWPNESILFVSLEQHRSVRAAKSEAI